MNPNEQDEFWSALEENGIIDSHPQENQHNRIANLPAKKPSSNKWLLILSAVLGVALLSAAVFAVIRFWPKTVVKQNIHTIRGCPEFYNLYWGMTPEEAGSNIELKHEIVNLPGEDAADPANAAIRIDEDEEFYLYGLKVKEIFVDFDGEHLNSVLFTFDKKSNTFKRLVELYTKIYGSATKESSSFFTWEGPKTTIDVFDYELLSDDKEKTIVVRYSVTENSQFAVLSFDGPETDPCDFLGDNYVFEKKPSYYIGGLTEDKDYTYEKFTTEGLPGFEKYTLYPKFKYLGIPKGYTAISFDVSDHEDTVGIVSYLFRLEKDNIANSLNDMKRALDSAYGQHQSCDYTSMELSELGIVTLSFDDLQAKIGEETQGIYNILWVSDDINITLNITIDPDKLFYEGSVAYTLRPPHEHAYTVKSEAAPTCEKDGVTEYTCSCGATYSETKAATGHTYSPATCTKAKTCSSCGKTEGAALGHTLADCVCSKCHAIVLTAEALQGTWKSTWGNPGAYCTITFSGSSYNYEYYCEMPNLGYTDYITMAGTYTVSGNVLTIRATATKTRITLDGVETDTYAYNYDDVIETYTPSMLVIEASSPYYKQ